MKRIYKPSVAEGWEWALPEQESDNLVIVEAFGKPIAATWAPMRMKVLRQDEHGRPWKEADMPWLGAHALILRPRAVAVLRDICLRAGELLPLTCKDADLVAWNVTTVADALDHERSKIFRHSDGSVMWVKRFSFKSEAVDGLVAFRIPELRNSIFVGPEFVDRVKEAKLTGAQFKEVWPVN